eukprot:2204031-Rhodomonas_salina.1
MAQQRAQLVPRQHSDVHSLRSTLPSQSGGDHAMHSGHQPHLPGVRRRRHVPQRHSDVHRLRWSNNFATVKELQSRGGTPIVFFTAELDAWVGLVGASRCSRQKALFPVEKERKIPPLTHSCRDQTFSHVATANQPGWYQIAAWGAATSTDLERKTPGVAFTVWIQWL